MSTATESTSLRPYIPELALNWEKWAGDRAWSEIEGSMVLADVSGFTAMSERLARFGPIGAEEITEIIGDTFGRLLGEAYLHGGDLLKFGGDALLLFFEGEDHAVRAAFAALGMRAELRKSGTFETSAGRVTLRMSVGAHSGVFRFFVVGGSHRELIVAGEAASETVTMEGAASTGQILLSPRMAAALPARLRGREEGPGVLLRTGAVDVEAWNQVSSHTSSALDPELFIPAALCEGVLGGGLDPEHRLATVAFIQFLDFDHLFEEDRPAAAAQALDELVRDVQQAVDQRGLSLLASDIAANGGKLILAAGAPRSTGNDEELMLLALREIISINRTLSIRVGVNRGQVFSGEVGPTFRRTYTVMGDTVNLAARLMAKAGPGQILSTSGVLDGSRTLFETSELEPFSVKGKKKPVVAFSVGQPKGSRSSIAEVGLPLIGRDVELATMIDAWEAVSGGEGRMVELTAEAGMGKTRLLEEFLGQVGDTPVISTECLLYQSTTPYFPMRALLRGLLGLEALSDHEVVDALESLVRRVAPNLEPWLSLLAVPLDVEITESEEVRQTDAEFRRTRLEEAVEGLLAATAAEPTIVIIDDTHWMDEASGNLMERLTGSLTDRPWLVVVSSRPGARGFTAPPDASGVVGVHLAVLDMAEAAALIHAATPDRPLRPAQVEDLASRAEGNPLFLIELLDALNRGEDVATLPRSVEGLIDARIDRLPGDDLTTLRQLSVLGSGFQTRHALAVLSNASSSDVRSTLRRLAEFLSVDKEGWVQFRQGLVRDAAYQGLPYRARQGLHAHVADSILSEAVDRPEEQAELLSLHYYEAARWTEAWTYSRLAGDSARDAYANAEAEQFYQRALKASKRDSHVEVEEQVTVLTELAEVAEQAGLFDRSLDALREAVKYTRDDPVTQAGLRLRRARAHARTGAYSQALSETARGLHLIEDVEGVDAERARARLLALRGAIRLQQGRPTEALNCANAAVEVAKESEELDALARAYQTLDGANEMLGRHHEVVYADEALVIYESLGDLQGCAHVANDRGIADYFGGRWDSALVSYGQAQDMFLRAGNETQAAMAAANIGEVLVGQGRLTEAEPLLTEAVRLLRAHNHLDLAMLAEAQLARLQIKAEDLDEGVTVLTGLFAEATAAGRWPAVLQVAVYLAQGLTGQGQADDALELLDTTDGAAAEDLEVFAAALARARAEVLAALGRRQAATEQVEIGLRSAREQGLLYDESQLLLLQSELKGSDGVPDPELLRQAQDLLQQLGVRTVVAV